MPAYRTTYPATVLADSPAVYLRLGDGSGQAATDASGNGRDGTYLAGVALGQPGALVGDNDPAASFDGASGAVTVPDVGVDFLDTLTLEAWVKMAAAGATGVIVDKGANAYLFRVVAGVPTFGKSGVSTIAATTVNVDDLEWHHLVVTKSGATTVMYVDGVARTGAVTDATLADNATAVHVGRTVAGAALFRGLMDELALYPTALTAARVLAHFNAGRAIYAGATARPGRAQLTAVLVADGVVGNPRRRRYASYGAATAVPGAPTYGVEAVSEAVAALAEQRGREVVSLTRFAAGVAIPPQYRRIAEAAAE